MKPPWKKEGNEDWTLWVDRVRVALHHWTKTRSKVCSYLEDQLHPFISRALEDLNLITQLDFVRLSRESISGFIAS